MSSRSMSSACCPGNQAGRRACSPCLHNPSWHRAGQPPDVACGIPPPALAPRTQHMEHMQHEGLNAQPPPSIHTQCVTLSCFPSFFHKRRLNHMHHLECNTYRPCSPSPALAPRRRPSVATSSRATFWAAPGSGGSAAAGGWACGGSGPGGGGVKAAGANQPSGLAGSAGQAGRCGGHESHSAWTRANETFPTGDRRSHEPTRLAGRCGAPVPVHSLPAPPGCLRRPGPAPGSGPRRGARTRRVRGRSAGELPGGHQPAGCHFQHAAAGLRGQPKGLVGGLEAWPAGDRSRLTIQGFEAASGGSGGMQGSEPWRAEEGPWAVGAVAAAAGAAAEPSRGRGARASHIAMLFV